LVLLGLSIVANNIPNNYSVFPRNDDDLTIARIICSSSRKLGYENPPFHLDTRRCTRLRCRCSRWSRALFRNSRFIFVMYGILAHSLFRCHLHGASHLPKRRL
jgi:hypothetical protein